MVAGGRGRFRSEWAGTMGYVACGQCSSLNDDTASVCNSCQRGLSGEGTTWTHQPDQRVQPRNPRSRGSDRDARYFDLDERYQRKAVPRVDVTLLVGVKAALCAGLILALPHGLLRQAYPDDLSRLIHHLDPGFGLHSPVVVAWSFVYAVVFSLPIGAALGFKNKLCFLSEAVSIGTVGGLFVGALLNWLSHSTQFTGLLVGVIQGALTAALAHWIEARFIRQLKLR